MTGGKLWCFSSLFGTSSGRRMAWQGRACHVHGWNTEYIHVVLVERLFLDWNGFCRASQSLTMDAAADGNTRAVFSLSIIFTHTMTIPLFVSSVPHALSSRVS